VVAAFAADFCAAGYRFRIEGDPARLGRHLTSYLTPFRVAPGHAAPMPTYRVAYAADHRARGTVVPAPYFLALDGEELRSSRSPGLVVDYALWLISQHTIAQISDRIAIHAAVASLDGAGVIMPAPANSGKSTLAAGLVDAGFGYLSDEMALINPDSAQVDPYPRALWVDRRSVALIPGLTERVDSELTDPDAREIHVRPDDIRPEAIGGSSPVRLVVAPRYEAGATTAAQPMGRAEAVQYLIVNSPNIGRFGSAGLAVLARVVRGAACYRLTVGDLVSGVAAVRDLLAAPSPAAAEADLPLPRPAEVPARKSITPDGIDPRFRPLPRAGIAAEELDGQVVLYDVSTGGVHLLNPMASLLWSCFDGETTLDDVGADVADVFDQPRDTALDAVVGMARELARLGALDGVIPDPA
jgi:hypothetical protein